jgi:hypothetical protein
MPPGDCLAAATRRPAVHRLLACFASRQEPLRQSLVIGVDYGDALRTSKRERKHERKLRKQLEIFDSIPQRGGREGAARVETELQGASLPTKRELSRGETDDGSGRNIKAISDNKLAVLASRLSSRKPLPSASSEVGAAVADGAGGPALV